MKNQKLIFLFCFIFFLLFFFFVGGATGALSDPPQIGPSDDPCFGVKYHLVSLDGVVLPDPGGLTQKPPVVEDEATWSGDASFSQPPEASFEVGKRETSPVAVTQYQAPGVLADLGMTTPSGITQYQ